MTEQSILRAAMWMAGSIACFLTMSVAGRIVAERLDVFQVMELRSVIGWIMLLPLVMHAGGFRAMRTAQPLKHLARNIAHYSGQYGWLYALTLIPLAELVSIEFTTPIWSGVLAAVFLGERLNRRKITAIALGLAGVLIIVRPGATQIEFGHLVMIAATLCFGISMTLTRSLTMKDGVVQILFWMLIIQSIIGLVPAVRVWQTPPADLWPALLVVAFTGTFSHFCLTRALSYAEVTVVSPMDFLRLPLAALIGWVLYNEGFDSISIAGAALILVGNLINLRRRSVVVASA